jgi:hypothetical protein
MTYQEYLKTDHWIDLRTRVLIRDNYTCKKCGFKYNSQVHHINYDKSNWFDYTENDLITLCSYCHAKTHNLKPDPKKLLRGVYNDPDPKFARINYLKNKIKNFTICLRNDKKLEYKRYKKSHRSLLIAFNNGYYKEYPQFLTGKEFSELFNYLKDNGTVIFNS